MTVRELSANVKPRNQAAKRTPKPPANVPATESQVAKRVRIVAIRARNPTAVPIPWMISRQARKMPAAMRGWLAPPGCGERARVMGGATRAPTTLPTTSPAMERPPQVSPRRYPENATAMTRTTMTASRMSTDRESDLDR